MHTTFFTPGERLPIIEWERSMPGEQASEQSLGMERAGPRSESWAVSMAAEAR
ncbi:hypothetical protein ASZ90_016182 [hydrocarbon metagenome]|uniref:Uncharacterized protein n=1 Tax=hydrocarbon metagenome TaxID=938273 RepID=A0A0W8EZW2_9ZZZZ